MLTEAGEVPWLSFICFYLYLLGADSLELISPPSYKELFEFNVELSNQQHPTPISIGH